LSLSANSLPENAGANATVGTLSTTDADGSDLHSYTLVTGTGSTDNAAFNLSGSTLRLTATADFETKNSYSVRIQTDDGNGGTFSKAFTISITNVNETPSFTKGGDKSHPALTNTAQLFTGWATNVDDGDSTVTQVLTFNVSNNNNALFSVQPSIASNGTLTYTPNGTAGSATVSVSLTDDNTINGNAALTSPVQTITITVAAGPEITLTGNGTNLTDGDATPSATDHSDFGSTPVASGSIVRTFTIGNVGTAVLDVSTITAGGDFTVGGITLPASIPVAGSTTFTVTFDPSVAGLRTATVNIASNDGDENPFDFSIQGTGIPAPDVTGINPGSGSTLGGTAVTISGTGFTGATGATVGGVPLSGFSVVNDTTITGTTGAHAPGLLNVAVTGSPNGASTGGTGLFSYLTPPSLTIDDVTLDEGDVGTTNFTFTVSLSSPALSGGVSFDIATANGTATQPGDYAPRSLSAQTIAEGGNRYTFSVAVNGDISVEPDETFLVNVTNVTGATVGDGQGRGTISNDDASADLSITKTDGATSAIPGASITYTITASNAGPDPATATVTDTLPASISGVSWTASGSGGASGNTNGTGNLGESVNLPVGGSMTYTVTGTIDPAATGTLTNTASISSAVSDPDGANNSDTDSDTLTPQADLSITKTDGVANVTPGGTVTYTITATNAGPSNAPGASVVDTLPASLSGVTWNSAGTGGGSGTASGSGNLSDTVSLPAGGSVTYTVSGTLAGAASGILSNTATVSTPGSVTEIDGIDNSATDIDTIATVVTLTATDHDAEENTPDTGTWRVSRNGTVGDLVINLQVDGGSTTSATDWTTTDATFASTGPNGIGTTTIPDGLNFIDIVLTPTDDLAAEADEIVILNLTSSALYLVGSQVDNDITIAANDFGVTNNGDSGEGTLRQAIENANAITGADTVTFHEVMADAVPDLILLTSGELTITESLDIPTPGADLLTISGNGTSRVFNIGAVAVTLEGMTITEGRVSGNPNNSGGGISNSGDLQIRNCVITNNTAIGAGFENAQGGGLFNAGTVTIEDSTLSGNSASGEYDFGGGIRNDGTLTLSRCTISGNSVTGGDTARGGGIYNAGTLTLNQCTVSGNAVTGNGSGSATGGGIHGGGTLTLNQCTISGNLVTSPGGGRSGGGVEVAGTARITNSIVLGNDAPNGPEVFGSPTYTGLNLVGIGVDTDPSDQVINAAALEDVFAVITNNPDTSVPSGTLSDHGGPTLTIALKAGGPAVDSGDNALALDANNVPLATDQRGTGFDRIVQSLLASAAPTVDLGAFELFMTPEFTNKNPRIGVSGPPLRLADATGATPPGGEFSGPGVSKGIFDPTNLSPGDYTLRYTSTDSYGVENHADFIVTVLAASLLELERPRSFPVSEIGRRSRIQLLTLRNVGNESTSRLTRIVVGPGRRDFRVTQPSIRTLIPGATTTMRATFRPKKAGTRRAIVKVTSNTGYDIGILTGRGVMNHRAIGTPHGSHIQQQPD
ncbi:MAG: choice-of-anchor D domain-containing protein, partial [Verrucomicrobiae bacterium]|nr:choice-of-anchor D domain-containing protein [Verrucomicrobiae bacterium]